jgi:hypothetical protein
VRPGDLVRFVATGEYGIVLDSEIDGNLQLFCSVMTSHTGYRYAFWDELEMIGVCG